MSPQGHDGDGRSTASRPTTPTSSSSSAPARAGHARQRALPEGREGRPDRSRQAPPARGLHQRRVGLAQPARLAGRAHDVWLVADSRGVPEPARLDLQGGRRHDRSLGRLLPALQGLGVPDPLRARPHRRRQPARLADRPVRPRALLRQGRGPAGRHAHQRDPGAAGQQQLQGDGQRRQAGRLQGRQHGPDGVQHGAARRAPRDDPGRLQLPGRQAARALVDADR